MAYKFSIGTYRHSGSLVAEEGLTVDAGGLTVTGDVQLDNGVIDNAELANSEITINGYATALGASVTLDTDDVAEGEGNLYWTVERGETMFDNKLAAADTGDLAEGSNLYYTDARVHAAISAGDGLTYDAAGQFAVTSSIAGAGLAWNAGVLSVDTAEIAAGLSSSVEAIVDAHVSGEDFITYSAGVISVDASAFTASFDAVLGARDTGDLAEGSNLYWTTARGEEMFDARLATKDTDDLAEGSNLYFTDARARAALSIVDAGGDGSFAYDSGSGVFTYTGPSAAEARAHFSAADGVRFDSSTGQFALTASVAGAGLGFAAGVLDVLTTGAIAVKSDRVLLSSSVAGQGLGFVAGAQGDVSVLNVNVDASSIEINADALRVKALGITNAMLSGAIENAKLVNSAVTVVAGEALSGGGIVALGSSITLDVEVNGDALEIVGDQVALKSTISGARTFANDVTISGDLYVNGTTTYINTTELVVEDALITIASGSAFAAGQGIQLGTDNSLQTVAGFADVGNALSSSLPLVAPAMKAATFYGNLEGAMLLGMETKSANATISKNVTRASANITLTLPSAPVVGQEHRIKCVGAADNVIVAAQAGGTIDGAESIVLESPSAAVSLVWDGSAWMVF